MRSTLEEIDKGALQVTQALLQGDTGNLSKPGCLWLLFEAGERGGKITVREMLAFLIGLAFAGQCPIVDPACTTKSPSKNLLLLVGWIASVAVGALDHAHTGAFFF